MLKCPNHELPGNIIIDNFYARLSFQDKTLLDTTCSGSFTRNKEEFKRDLLDRIKENAEDWENDKGKESGYADKPPFKPLPPEEGNEEKEKEKKKKGTKKKKKNKGNKKKEVTAYPRVYEITIGNRKYVAPDDYCDNESKYDDLPMPFTYISNHDLNEHTTFDIANLWETNSENDDDNDCHSVSAIHASSHNDIESSKLGEEVFANPLATGHYVLDTSPSNNNNGVDTDKPIVKDNYSISYDDTVPPIFDDYYKECYDIDKTLLDTTCSGSFTRNKEEFKRDLLDRIKENAEDWENDKGKESGYADKPPFKPLPPEEGNEEKEKEKKKGTKKKKKNKGNKKKEERDEPHSYRYSPEPRWRTTPSSWETAVLMKMAVVSMEKPSGGTSPSGVPEQTPVPRSWLRWRRLEGFLWFRRT
ncbi:hypothetical protein QYE76_061024 [Lolium multiflorum]|uniref:Uncharacterized protein n=1 Tax=Lolium multiflorum TaxID=4521 RepID=A0AAD8W6T8_LOLMU|nr:hypothetical protein QYE76_061024 [Lolium multiflorum]